MPIYIAVWEKIRLESKVWAKKKKKKNFEFTQSFLLSIVEMSTIFLMWRTNIFMTNVRLYTSAVGDKGVLNFG